MTQEDAEHIASFHITPSQKKVLIKLLEGKSAKQIGSEMSLSHFTINNHTRAIFSAYDVKKRTALMEFFVVPPKL